MDMLDEEEQKSQPLFRHFTLVVIGAIIMTALTMYGVFDDPAKLIREDVRVGPMIAASKIFIPILVAFGVLYYLASIKKCKHCGKIFFLKKSVEEDNC